MNSKLFFQSTLSAALLLVPALCSSSVAQQPQGTGAGTGNGNGAAGSYLYNFRFSVVALSPEKVESLDLNDAVDLEIVNVSYETGSTVRTLSSVPHHTRSHSYLYRGNAPLTFFREVPDASPKPPVAGKAPEPPPRKVLAEVKPGRQWRSVLVLATPGDQGGTESLHLEAIEDDPRSFPEHSILLANRSSAPIRLEVEGESKEIPAGENLRLPLQLQQARMIPLRFFATTGGKPKNVYSTSIPFRPGQRLFVLLQSDPSTGLRIPPLFLFDTPAKTRFDDFDPAKKAAPQL